jgi:hypothetical protein
MGKRTQIPVFSSDPQPSSVAPERISRTNPFAITDGEVNFVRGLIHDGSVDRDSWRALMDGWGYCERHAWVALSIEMALLDGFCMRSTYLYVHLLERGVAALARGIPGERWVAARRLRQRGCLICDHNPRRRGILSDEDLAQGKDVRRLRLFAKGLEPLWRNDLCPRCSGTARGGRLCRRHLLEAAKPQTSIDFQDDDRRLSNLLRHLEIYERSFTWEHRGSDGPRHRVALLSAIGWCSGWSHFTALVGIESAATLKRTAQHP